MRSIDLGKLSDSPKITVMGYSGSGKSTLAGFLGKRLSLPVLYLDTVQFLPGWEVREREEKQRIVREFLDVNCETGWVIDGNYLKLEHERRMSESELIVFMKFNRVSCFIRAYRRSRKYKNLSRPSMTEGCEEKFDAEFRRWLLWEGRSRQRRQSFKAVLSMYKDKCVVIKNQRQLDEFMRAFE